MSKKIVHQCLITPRSSISQVVAFINNNEQLLALLQITKFCIGIGLFKASVLQIGMKTHDEVEPITFKARPMSAQIFGDSLLTTLHISELQMIVSCE